MTRRRGMVAAAGTLAVILLLVVGTLALRSLGTGPEYRPDRTAAPPQPPESETLFLPGHDDSPGGFSMTSPANASGKTRSVRLALDNARQRTDHQLGLSFDARELANPIWDSEDSNLALTLGELEEPALRFGGNGIDRHVWWTSSDEPAPEWAQATVTPEDLERVAAVAEEVDASVTIDLDLGHDDPDRAADMAAHAKQAFGDRLLAVAIGNEPNGFFHANQPQLAVRDATWDTEAYQQALTEYSAALEEAAPGLPVAGPGAYDAEWWRAFAESEIPNQRALSLHWYPLWDCQGPYSSIANPAVDDLTDPVLRERARAIVGMGAEVAEEHDLPLWMEETGPTSCPGTNDTSRTHAQALWTVDYTMTLAELGVERTAFHATLQACEGGAPMSPICARGPYEEPGQIVEGRTSYLAMMMLGDLPEGKLLSSTTGGDGDVVVHGVIADNGELALLVVDLRDPTTVEDVVPLEVTAPSGLPSDGPSAWTLAEGALLRSTSLEAQQSTLTAMSPASGQFAGARLARAEPLAITSIPGSAMLLRLDPADAGS